MLTNWAVSTVSSVLVLWFYAGRPPDPAIVAVLLIAAALFAFLESVRAGLDDNIVAPIPTALAILSLSRMNLQALALSLPGGFPFRAVALAAGVNLAVAFLTWRLRLVSRSGALSGAILGFGIVAFGGWRHYGLLWAFFLLGTAATKLGYRRKKAAGLAESNEGRRGAANVWANGGVPLAFLMLAFPPIGFPAALAAALSDTLGTEVGILYGRNAFSILTLRRLAVGTPGAVSIAGTPGEPRRSGADGARGVGAEGHGTAPALADRRRRVLGSLAESAMKTSAAASGSLSTTTSPTR